MEEDEEIQNETEMKDPAFLFYSKDYYEGTRMMLPEERACYVDLMIYQHQNGIIPNDIPRLKMYCSGCSEETIQRVLKDKFNQMVDGWLNQKLNHVIDERLKFRPKKIASATLAGLISSSKLSKKVKEKIKKSFRISDFISENEEFITDEESIKSAVRDWFNQMVDHTVKNLAIANAIAIEDYNLSFIDKEYLEVVTTWLNYKKDRKEMYKCEQSLKSFFKKLKDLSGNNPATASLIIEQSMANNWAGIFPLKNYHYGASNQTNYRKDKDAETIRAAENLQRELAAESRKT